MVHLSICCHTLPIQTVVGLCPCATNVAVIVDNPGLVVSGGCRPGPAWCCHRLLLLLLATQQQLNSVTQSRSVRNGATLTDDSQYHFRALSGGTHAAISTVGFVHVGMQIQPASGPRPGPEGVLAQPNHQTGTIPRIPVEEKGSSRRRSDWPATIK